jgi:hypothetical protein
VWLVKPDNEGKTYEVWVLTPTLIGEIEYKGYSRYEVDGQHFTNLGAASKFLLEGSAHAEMALESKLYVKTPNRPVLMSGLDLVEQGVWHKYCNENNINPRDLKAMQKEYPLTLADIKKLGV